MKLVYHEGIHKDYNQSRNLDKSVFYTSQQQYCQLGGRKASTLLFQEISALQWIVKMFSVLQLITAQDYTIINHTEHN